ncbi:MAG: HEAT repeat domain-containing protein, partial [Elusimicrobiaceae bacterium]
VPVLINMLTDGSKIVSDAAETALAGYREKSVTTVLTDKLYDGDEKLEGRIIDTLGTRNDPQSFDVIVRTLRKGSEACKVKAALALSKMGNTEACDSLIRIAERPDDFEPELVKTACFSLGRLYCPRAIPALIRISGSPDPDFRFAAVNSFKEMKNKAAFDALVARLDDPAEYVRLETIEALLTLKDPNLAEKLAPLIKSKNDRVAGGAAAVLSKLNTEQSHNAIKKLDELKYRDQVIEKEKDSADQIDDASKNIVPVY